MEDLSQSKFHKFIAHPEAPVAPHAGAWIETIPLVERQLSQQVAPHAGAWIETSK